MGMRFAGCFLAGCLALQSLHLAWGGPTSEALPILSQNCKDLVTVAATPGGESPSRIPVMMVQGTQSSTSFDLLCAANGAPIGLGSFTRDFQSGELRVYKEDITQFSVAELSKADAAVYNMEMDPVFQVKKPKLVRVSAQTRMPGRGVLRVDFVVALATGNTHCHRDGPENDAGKDPGNGTDQSSAVCSFSDGKPGKEILIPRESIQIPVVNAQVNSGEKGFVAAEATLNGAVFVPASEAALKMALIPLKGSRTVAIFAEGAEELSFAGGYEVARALGFSADIAKTRARKLVPFFSKYEKADALAMLGELQSLASAPASAGN